ncbi:hypothetical protein P8V03_15620 [Clostridium sp. A1-XYC3]|uniref:Uncharacterized protein n=1 Tax=Clostridium tanneri TaxID=3037988 RepID=A0ABU4JWU5_9CLOT|nr:hypothetical protein [Clostridium sp. A1-XYC3]MDW8802576.1 hypothetical protein [Clostridium sp. A1-XYC3]
MAGISGTDIVTLFSSTFVTVPVIVVGAAPLIDAVTEKSPATGVVVGTPDSVT